MSFAKTKSFISVNIRFKFAPAILVLRRRMYQCRFLKAHGVSSFILQSDAILGIIFHHIFWCILVRWPDVDAILFVLQNFQQGVSLAAICLITSLGSYAWIYLGYFSFYFDGICGVSPNYSMMTQGSLLLCFNFSMGVSFFVFAVCLSYD